MTYIVERPHTNKDKLFPISFINLFYRLRDELVMDEFNIMRRNEMPELIEKDLQHIRECEKTLDEIIDLAEARKDVIGKEVDLYLLRSALETCQYHQVVEFNNPDVDFDGVVSMLRNHKGADFLVKHKYDGNLFLFNGLDYESWTNHVFSIGDELTFYSFDNENRSDNERLKKIIRGNIAKIFGKPIEHTDEDSNYEIAEIPIGDGYGLRCPQASLILKVLSSYKGNVEVLDPRNNQRTPVNSMMSLIDLGVSSGKGLKFYVEKGLDSDEARKEMIQYLRYAVGTHEEQSSLNKKLETV